MRLLSIHCAACELPHVCTLQALKPACPFCGADAGHLTVEVMPAATSEGRAPSTRVAA